MNGVNMRAIVLMLLTACAGTHDGTKAVLVGDAHIGDGDGPSLDYRWEREGDWYVRGQQKVPAGVVAYLRDLAKTAPGLRTAPLPKALQFGADTVLERSGDIWQAATEGTPWLEDWIGEDPSRALVAKAAREKLIDEGRDTDHTLLSITLPGSPTIVIATSSQAPYAQPWQVMIGDEPFRKVLSLEMSRYAMLLTDPAGPNYRYLEGATYWANGFWKDSDIWERLLGDRANHAFARQLCAKCDGWEAVNKAWSLEDADIGNINLQPLSLQVSLTATGDQLVGEARWWNRYEDQELQFDWNTFVDLHARVTKAAARLPFLERWESGGRDRSIGFDGAGRVGNTESSPGFFHAPVWKHSKLEGEPDIELKLRIGGEVVATLLMSDGSQGAIVLDGHPTLPWTAEIEFHPTTGRYAVIKPDGKVEPRQMEPVKPD